VSRHRVRVAGVPAWVPVARLLGAGAWVPGVDGVYEAVLDTPAAADLSARLRGLGMGGQAFAVECSPALPRAAVRAARLEDARRRRDTTPGFERAGTRLDAEGRMSLTPEALARALAAELPVGGEVWDLGCGAGGNAIAFARAGHNVVAVERDHVRLADARHNAGVPTASPGASGSCRRMRWRFWLGSRCRPIPRCSSTRRGGRTGTACGVSPRSSRC
jgi:hypothetical protein